MADIISSAEIADWENNFENEISSLTLAQQASERRRRAQGQEAAKRDHPQLRSLFAEADALIARTVNLRLAPALMIGREWELLDHVLACAVEPPMHTLLFGKALPELRDWGLRGRPLVAPSLHPPDIARALALFLSETGLKVVRDIDLLERSASGHYALSGVDNSNATPLKAEINAEFERLQAYVCATANTGDGLLCWAP